MYGDIYGFVIQQDCDNDCCCENDDSTDDYTCPASEFVEPIESWNFTDADDEFCRL